MRHCGYPPHLNWGGEINEFRHILYGFCVFLMTFYFHLNITNGRSVKPLLCLCIVDADLSLSADEGDEFRGAGEFDVRSETGGSSGEESSHSAGSRRES